MADRGADTELELFNKRTRVPKEAKTKRLPRNLARLRSGNFRGRKGPNLSSGARNSTRPKSKDGAVTFHFALTYVSKTGQKQQQESRITGISAAHVKYITRPAAVEQHDPKKIVRDDKNSAEYGQKYAENGNLDKVQNTPSSFGNTGITPEERANFWNEFEKSERINGRVQHRLVVELPHELPAHARLEIMKSFAEKELVSKNLGFWGVVHAPDKHNDNRNFHGHFVFTDRPVRQYEDGTWDFMVVETHKTARGFIDFRPERQKKLREMNGRDSRIWVASMRKSFCDISNEVMKKSFVSKRYDYRTYKEMGISKVPTRHLGTKYAAMEAQGIPTEIGDFNTASERKFLKEALISDEWARLHSGKTQNGNTYESFKVTELDVSDASQPNGVGDAQKEFLGALRLKIEALLDKEERLVRVIRREKFLENELGGSKNTVLNRPYHRARRSEIEGERAILGVVEQVSILRQQLDQHRADGAEQVVQRALATMRRLTPNPDVVNEPVDGTGQEPICENVAVVQSPESEPLAGTIVAGVEDARRTNNKKARLQNAIDQLPGIRDAHHVAPLGLAAVHQLDLTTIWQSMPTVRPHTAPNGRVRIALNHGSRIRDFGHKLAITEIDDRFVDPAQQLPEMDKFAANAEALLKLVQGKGWTSIGITGSPEFMDMVAYQAKGMNLALHDYVPNEEAETKVRNHMERLEIAEAKALAAEAALASVIEESAHLKANLDRQNQINAELYHERDALITERNQLRIAVPDLVGKLKAAEQKLADEKRVKEDTERRAAGAARWKADLETQIAINQQLALKMKAAEEAAEQIAAAKADENGALLAELKQTKRELADAKAQAAVDALKLNSLTSAAIKAARIQVDLDRQYQLNDQLGRERDDLIAERDELRIANPILASKLETAEQNLAIEKLAKDDAERRAADASRIKADLETQIAINRQLTLNMESRKEAEERTAEAKRIELRDARAELQKVTRDLADAESQVAADAQQLQSLTKELESTKRENDTNKKAWARLRDQQKLFKAMFVRIWEKVGELTGNEIPLDASFLQANKLGELEAALIKNIEDFWTARMTTRAQTVVVSVVSSAPSVTAADPLIEELKSWPLLNEVAVDKLLEKLEAGENVVGVVPPNADVPVTDIQKRLSSAATSDQIANLYARSIKYQAQLDKTVVPRNLGDLDKAKRKADSAEIGRRLFAEIAVISRP